METYRFGPFRLDRNSYQLFKGEVPVPVAPKVIDLLFLLVSRPTALVTKDDILQVLWPDVAVTDNAMTQVVSDLRQALGDSSASPVYVQTVPRRGYRFVATVEAGPADVAAPVRSTRPKPRLAMRARVRLRSWTSRTSHAKRASTGCRPASPRR